MIDYISASSFLKGKDKPNFSKCTLEAVYNSGWQRYYIEGCKKLELDFNENLNMLKLKGSIMYYWQGHNLSFDRQGFISAIDYISNMIKIPLWKSDIEAFEYGKVIEVDMKPKEYIKHHSAKSSERLVLYENQKDKGNLRGWENKNVRLKMYDAKTNFDIKLGQMEHSRKDILQSLGYSESNLLKWEAHYKKPHLLNNGHYLMLADLVNPNWEKVFNNDLYEQYKKLIPMKNYIEPNNKKDLSTSDIIVFELLEGNLNEGKNAEEVKKMLYARINSISDEILSKSDKDARKRQIKALIDKIQESPESKWDLSAKLSEALEEIH